LYVTQIGRKRLNYFFRNYASVSRKKKVKEKNDLELKMKRFKLSIVKLDLIRPKLIAELESLNKDIASLANRSGFDLAFWRNRSGWPDANI
jgi:hypothetical protein